MHCKNLSSQEKRSVRANNDGLRVDISLQERGSHAKCSFKKLNYWRYPFKAKRFMKRLILIAAITN